MITPPTQLRLVVETEDFDAALAFYRDALGLSYDELIRQIEAFEFDSARESLRLLRSRSRNSAPASTA
mgnify:CR=1 FL=1